MLNIHHAVTHRPVSKKNTFLDSGDLKTYKSGGKTRHRKFSPKTILQLPNGSRVMKVKSGGG